MMDLLNVSTEQYGHAAHLRLTGELDMSTAPIFERRLEEAESNGNTAIVLDLEHLTFMDGSGLRSFIRAADRARQRRRIFVIVKAPAIARRILEVTETMHLLGTAPVEGKDFATA